MTWVSPITKTPRKAELHKRRTRTGTPQKDALFNVSHPASFTATSQTKIFPALPIPAAQEAPAAVAADLACLSGAIGHPGRRLLAD